MNNYLLFESPLPDVKKWMEKINNFEPAGIEHARLIASHLPCSIKLAPGPWNEEDYAWGFLTKCEGICVSVLIGQYEEGWLVTVIPVSFFAFLRLRKIRLAVDFVTNAIEDFLRADSLFRNVRRYSEPEFHSQERADQRE